MNLKLLVVEGNLIEENRNFKRAGIETHTESLSDSLNFFNKNINLDVVNHSSDKNIKGASLKNPLLLNDEWEIKEDIDLSNDNLKIARKKTACLQE